MRNEAEIIWSRAVKKLKSMLNDDVFKLWFAPIKPSQVENGTLILEVANDFCEVWLKDNYHQLLEEVVEDAGILNDFFKELMVIVFEPYLAKIIGDFQDQGAILDLRRFDGGKPKLEDIIIEHRFELFDSSAPNYFSLVPHCPNSLLKTSGW